MEVEIVDEPVKEVKEKNEDDDVKDTWDAETTEDEQEEEGIVLYIDREIIHDLSRSHWLRVDIIELINFR